MRRYNGHNKGFKYLIISIVVLLFLGLSLFTLTHNKAANATDNYDHEMSPTIMIPGSSANVDTLDGLIQSADQKSKHPHSVLKVTVNTNNSLTYSGHIQAKDKHPYIVVAFQNNQDGFDNIKKQAKWFNIAFKSLQNKYHFHNFNAFGHSNGSLIWTYFLEDYFNQSDATIKHLITVGAPYNLEETSTKHHTELLNQLIKGRKNLPKNLSYYSIAGTKQYSDDGIVPLSSVDAGKYIYQDSIKQYMLVTLTGSNAEHSSMLTNPQFITLFRQFILSPEKSATKEAQN